MLLCYIQGDIVRALKQNKVAEIDIKNAVNELKARKKLLEEKEYELAPEVSNRLIVAFLKLYLNSSICRLPHSIGPKWKIS